MIWVWPVHCWLHHPLRRRLMLLFLLLRRHAVLTVVAHGTRASRLAVVRPVISPGGSLRLHLPMAHVNLLLVVVLSVTRPGGSLVRLHLPVAHVNLLLLGKRRHRAHGAVVVVVLDAGPSRHSVAAGLLRGLLGVSAHHGGVGVGRRFIASSGDVCLLMLLVLATVCSLLLPSLISRGTQLLLVLGRVAPLPPLLGLHRVEPRRHAAVPVLFVYCRVVGHQHRDGWRLGGVLVVAVVHGRLVALLLGLPEIHRAIPVGAFLIVALHAEVAVHLGY
mmetsp:Transcript_20511/g.47080  ORF Transcript_20511/g.47080 Transcript_20511/m.47080 type:complete len:275 (-) Transcript_20511:530-1354(-)